ncbi:hypothetical protein QJS10_CPA01g02926 [Acorus calamus]|uniref:Uncharacterized protein n=1 Tax=Acorus calamus TaxID=4465 RepID=A0AAV9FFX4_ACOCL|nr:hypothetical protein QJS10_CPA01g02926 [Acorus calamus]
MACVETDVAGMGFGVALFVEETEGEEGFTPNALDFTLNALKMLSIVPPRGGGGGFGEEG